MSLRAFARGRGVSLGAVQRAIGDGRLTAASVGQDARGRPIITDPARATQEWAAHSRPRLLNAPAGPGRGPPSALAGATMRERWARARAMEFELARKRRDVVPAAEVELRWAGLVVAARTAILGIPSRAKGRLPHLTATDLAVLEALIREALGELAGPAQTAAGADRPVSRITGRVPRRRGRSTTATTTARPPTR